ncbi:hypothetical protein GGI35DRAFT_138215 [Trichoderma velutinum]
MSRATRRSYHARNRIISPLLNNVTDNNGFEETKEAFCSLAISKCVPQHLDELWQELRRSYEAEDTHNGQPFPNWALRNLPLEQMKAMIRVAYCKDLGALDHYAVSISSHFRVEPWRFILFFNYIEQGRARILRKISINRPTLTFEQLYEEVRRNRLNRLSARKVSNRRQKNPRADFQPSDYRGCLQGSDDGGGSDEEIEDESEIESETGDEGNDNIGQEPRFELINEHISMSHQESNDNGGYDAENSHQRDHHADNLDGINAPHEEPMIARDNLDGGSVSSPQTNLSTWGTNSPITIPDDSEPTTLAGPMVETSTRNEIGLSLSNFPQYEARNHDMDQSRSPSPGLYSIALTLANTEKENVNTQKQKVQDTKKQLVQDEQQLENGKNRLLDVESIVAGLAKLDEEYTVSKSNIKKITNELSTRKIQWQNSQANLTTITSTSVEEYASAVKSFFLDTQEGYRKHRAEEDAVAENKKKRAKLAVDMKKFEATSAKTAPSIPIRSMEAS